MEIKRDFYLVFYEALHERFLKREFKKELWVKYNKLSPYVWRDAISKLTGKPKVCIYFSGKAGDIAIKFFYNQYLDFTSIKKKPWPVCCEIEDLILIKSLVYLGMGIGLKLVIKGREGKEEKIDLHFDTLQNRQEWASANIEATLDLLIESFKNKHMSASVENKKNINSYTEQKSNSIMEALNENEKTPVDFNVTLNNKDILYNYIFNFANPLHKRLYAIDIFSAHPILSSEEILNLYHIPERKIYTKALRQMHELGASLNDKNRYLIIHHCTHIVINDLYLLNDFCIGGLKLNFLYCTVSIWEIMRMFTKKPDGIGISVLSQLNETLYTMSNISFTDDYFNNPSYNLDFLFDEASPIEVIQEIVLESYLAGATTDLINNFKFILIRKHLSLYLEMKTFLSSILKDKEEEYNNERPVVISEYVTGFFYDNLT